jgi:hypothetical protein
MGTILRTGWRALSLALAICCFSGILQAHTVTYTYLGGQFLDATEGTPGTAHMSLAFRHMPGTIKVEHYPNESCTVSASINLPQSSNPLISITSEPSNQPAVDITFTINVLRPPQNGMPEMISFSGS